MYGSKRTAGIVLALLLLFSGTQCIIACSGGPCAIIAGSNLPPCHRHHAPADHTSSCPHSQIMADVRPGSSAHFGFSDSVAAPLVSTACLISPETIAEHSELHTQSPPGVIALTTVVLRI